MADWIILLTSLLENNKQQSKDNSICYSEEENVCLNWLLTVSGQLGFFLHFELSYVIYVEFCEVSESVS